MERSSHQIAARIAVALAAVGALAPAGATAQAVPVCSLLAFSPAFAQDRTGFCLRAVTGDAALYRTTDAGRTWTRLAAPSATAAGAPRQLIVSPRYAADQTVYLHGTKGLFAWSDPATGFTAADPLAEASTQQVLAAFVDPVASVAAPLVGDAQVAFAYAHQTSPARMSPPARVPVTGAAPSRTERFLVPGTRAAAPLALATIPPSSENGGRYEVRQCDWELRCGTVLAVLPQGAVEGAWLSPAYERDRTVYVAMWTKAGIEVLRSTAGGRGFTRMPGAARALAATNEALRASGAGPALPVGLAVDGASPRRLALRVSIGPSRPGTPSEQVFTSADGGASWRRAGYAWADRRGGTLPWYSAAQTSMASEGSRLWYVAGRLFALADSGRDKGGGSLYCSTDHGRRWTRGRCG